MLSYSRPATAIKSGDEIMVGFGFPNLPYSYNIRDYGELRELLKRNPALTRNVVAHYLRVCGLSTADIGKFLNISPSRVSSVSAKGRRDIYPARRRRDYTETPSYSATTSRVETRRWNSRVVDLRSRSPRNSDELMAHLVQQAGEEIVDAEDALRHFPGFDERRLVAAAFSLGREVFSERRETLGEGACPCNQCDAFREKVAARAAEASSTDDDAAN